MAALLSIQKAKVLHCTQWSQDAAVGFPFPEPSTRNDQLRTRAHTILSELLADSKLSACKCDVMLGNLQREARLRASFQQFPPSHAEIAARKEIASSELQATKQSWPKTGSIAQYQLRCLGNVVPCHDSQDGNSHWPVSCS